MSTDYYLVCFDCKNISDSPLASGSSGYGFKVWSEGVGEMMKFLGHKEDIGFHEAHDLRIVSEHYELHFEEELEDK